MKRRQKRLCPLGNSLAMIIDKPILRAMGLGTRTELRVYTDGERIIAERMARPAHDPDEAARLAFGLKKRAFLETAEVLDNAMGAAEMEMLGAEPRALFRFRTS
ncbi:MAG: hypothetical protein ABI678_26440, partial [Kofleriaceae bacterium]